MTTRRLASRLADRQGAFMKLASVIGLLVLIGITQLGAGALAQPITRPVRLGFLAYNGNAPLADLVKGLQALGYEEGKNLTIEYRSASNKSEDLPKLAAELVSLKPDVLIGSSSPSVLALKKETDAIPILMMNVGVNPATMGWVQSLAHPGRNLTGFSNEATLWITKTLQLATDILPGSCCILVLRNSANPAQRAGTATRDAAARLRIEVKFIDAADEEYRVVATYVDKILKGATPADLPAQQPTKFVIVINLKPPRLSGSPFLNQSSGRPTS
jgi:putative ABC transport system substrate-binding protein